MTPNPRRLMGHFLIISCLLLAGAAAIAPQARRGERGRGRGVGSRAGDSHGGEPGAGGRGHQPGGVDIPPAVGGETQLNGHG